MLLNPTYCHYFNQVLLCYLSKKISSFSHDSSTDANTTTETDRLVSALAISLLVVRYDLKLKWEQWLSLFQGLQFPVHMQKADCMEILADVQKTLGPDNIE